MTNYEKLVAECIAAVEKPLSPPCNESVACRRAGGCYHCQVIRPFEYRRDREMDAEMFRKRGCSPQYIAAARRVIERCRESEKVQ
jgi:hypothetical protein